MIFPFIPAICQAPTCGVIFFSDKIAQVRSTTEVIPLISRFYRPCEVCGGRARVPDGNYSAFSREIFDRESLQKVEAALKVLRRTLGKSATPIEVQILIDEEYYFLRPINKFLLSKGAAHAGAHLGLLVAVMALLKQPSQDSTLSPIHIEIKMVQVLEEVAVNINPDASGRVSEQRIAREGEIKNQQLKQRSKNRLKEPPTTF